MATLNSAIFPSLKTLNVRTYTNGRYPPKTNEKVLVSTVIPYPKTTGIKHSVEIHRGIYTVRR